MFETHKELKEQVVVWILVLKADGALFLQMDGVDEGDSAFIPVGLHVVSLRHPGRTTRKKRHQIHFTLTIQLPVFPRVPLTHLLQVSLSSPRGPFSREVARLLNPTGMESHWSKRTPLPRE